MNAISHDMNQVVGTSDILLVTLDALRFDVAQRLAAEGRTPHLERVLPGGRWEERHAPGNFTFASHQAMFAGFLPTPAAPGRHERLFALAFEGSETTGKRTCVFDGPDIVHGLADRGYHTACIGGVGFFNKRNPLGRVLPGLFDESHWDRSLGVTDPASFENQIALAARVLAHVERSRRVFLFMNVSAIHQPNRHYVPGATEDSIETHAAALEYVDRHALRLLDLFRARGPAFVILTSDHGTCYGEGGYRGHRVSHPAVWTVPYAHFLLEPGRREAGA